MNDNTYTILIGILTIALLADIVLIFTAIIMHKLLNDAIKAVKYKNNTYANIDDKVPKVLDMFVKEVFTDYRVKYLDCDETLIYINDEKEQQILSEMASLCSERMSPTLADKLTLVWSYESLGAVIADKIYLTVVNYVSSKNTKIMEDNYSATKKELNAAKK